VLTLIPGSAVPDVGFFQADKIVHFFIFGILMILASYGLKKYKAAYQKPENPLVFALVYSLFFGVLIEVIQQFVPGRSFSIADIVANSIGVALGYWAYRDMEKRKIV
jgi:VanZ family protein